MSATKDLMTQAENRFRLYSFLSRLYREEVDGKLLLTMKDVSGKTDVDDSELAGEYSKLHTFLQNTDINQEFLDDLAADYTSLFLGIGRHPAHPYESVYRSEDKIVMREPRNEVMKVYREEGLQKIDDFKEPEDHVAIEFEFMAYLCTKMKEALENKKNDEWSRLLSVQGEFFDKHIKSWVPAFCNDAINGSSKYDFYPIWGAITKRCIALEETTLKELKEGS